MKLITVKGIKVYNKIHCENKDYTITNPNAFRDCIGFWILIVDNDTYAITKYIKIE